MVRTLALATRTLHGLLPVTALVWLGMGCSMDPKECAKLREAAYDVINTPGNCETDADCRASEWPGCPKAINATNLDKIKKFQDAAKKGKCVDPALTCKPVPPLYCQTGLCVFKYKEPPRDDEMRIE